MEYASASRALVHPDTPVISLNEALADCQSDAHAGQIAAARSAHESPEYPLSIGGSNTTPAIQHPDFHESPISAASILTVPASGEYLMALSSKLTMTW